MTGTAEQFIGDPNLNEAVTGSPFNTNFVRIEGGPKNLDLRTSVFAVSGKLSTVVRPTPMITQRSTYSRTGKAGDPVVAQQDVFALAPPAPATVTLDSNSPALGLTEGDSTGSWYAQSKSQPVVAKYLAIDRRQPLGHPHQYANRSAPSSDRPGGRFPAPRPT